MSDQMLIIDMPSIKRIIIYNESNVILAEFAYGLITNIKNQDIAIKTGGALLQRAWLCFNGLCKFDKLK